MEKALNSNYKETLKGLASFEKGSAFAREVMEYLNSKGSNRTFNSVNATLAAAASKGYVSKEKAVCGEKFLTKYTLTEKGTKALEDSPAEPLPAEVPEVKIDGDISGFGE